MYIDFRFVHNPILLTAIFLSTFGFSYRHSVQFPSLFLVIFRCPYGQTHACEPWNMTPLWNSPCPHISNSRSVIAIALQGDFHCPFIQGLTLQHVVSIITTFDTKVRYKKKSVDDNRFIAMLKNGECKTIGANRCGLPLDKLSTWIKKKNIGHQWFQQPWTKAPESTAVSRHMEWFEPFQTTLLFAISVPHFSYHSIFSNFSKNFLSMFYCYKLNKCKCVVNCYI